MQPPPVIFDEALFARRRAAAKEGLFLCPEFEAALLDRLDDVTREFPVAALLGKKGEARGERRESFEARLKVHPKIKDFLLINDLSPLVSHLSLLVSLWDLAFTNDVPGLLTQVRRALRPDGWFLAVFFGGETLIELRRALMQAEEEIMGGITPRVAPMIDLRDAAGLLQRAGFALPVADHDIVTVHYRDMFALMQDLRRAGLGNMLAERRKAFTPRKVFMRAAEIYQQTFGLPDGKIPATFEVIFLSAWSPDATQQKPLLPGTATQRLADALDAKR